MTQSRLLVLSGMMVLSNAMVQAGGQLTSESSIVYNQFKAFLQLNMGDTEEQLHEGSFYELLPRINLHLTDVVTSLKQYDSKKEKTGVYLNEALTSLENNLNDLASEAEKNQRKGESALCIQKRELFCTTMTFCARIHTFHASVLKQHLLGLSPEVRGLVDGGAGSAAGSGSSSH